MSAKPETRDRGVRACAPRAARLFTVLAMTAAIASCGPLQISETHWSTEPREDAAFAEIRATLGEVEQLMATERWSRADHDQLRSAVASAHAALDTLETECLEPPPGRGCTDPLLPAASLASEELSRSLEQLGVLLAYGRRIMPPDPPPDDPRDDPCKPRPVCPHKGGDKHHDRCADTEPPNLYPGCDVLVRAKHFDAVTKEGVLWEVKTEKWSEYQPWLVGVLYLRHLADARLEDRIARSCGLRFTYGVSDAGLYRALERRLGRIVKHIPRCARP